MSDFRTDLMFAKDSPRLTDEEIEDLMACVSPNEVDGKVERIKRMEIKIKYQDGMEEIKQAHRGEWYDLRAGEDIRMKAGEYKRISLGVAIKLPEGFEAIVAPRSSTFEKFGIIMSNSIGVIDNAYSGDNDIWSFGAIAMRDTRIEKNDRIAQFRIIYGQPECEIVKVDHLDGTDRGGFGSTGHK